METMVFRVSVSRWISDGWTLFLKDIGTFTLIGIFSTLFVTVLPFVWGPVWTAMIFAVFRFMEQGNISVSDYFEGYRFFLPAFLGSLLIMLFTLVGLIFLIIPGLVIFSMYLFTFSYICQNGKDFGEAMRLSRKVAGQDYFGFTLLALALTCLNFLGALFFYVGLVFTLPVSACAIALAHREFEGLPTVPAASVTFPTKPITIE